VKIEAELPFAAWEQTYDSKRCYNPEASNITNICIERLTAYHD